MQPEEQLAPENTVIVGAGPVGLLAGLYMSQLGHDVTIIEKRDNYTSRENELLMHQKTIRQLLQDFSNFYQCGYQIRFKYSGSDIRVEVTHNPAKVTDPNAKLEDIDIAFLEALKSAHSDVPTNAFQKYITQKQQLHGKNKNFKILTEAQVVNLNPSTLSLNYKDAVSGDFIELQTHNLIVGEGAQRHITRKFISDKNVVPVAAVDDVPCAHAVGFLEVGASQHELYKTLAAQKPLAGVALPLTVSSLKKQMPDFKSLGWSNQSTPKFYIVAEKNNRFYVACEIPKEWQDNLKVVEQSKDKEKIAAAKQNMNQNIEKWFKVAIKETYPGLNTENIKLICDGSLKAQSFESQPPTRLRSAYTTAPNGVRVFFVGDALFTPNYKLGMGVLFGAIAVKAVASCFNKSGQFTTATPMTKLVRQLQVEFSRLNKVNKVAILFNQTLPLTYKYAVDPLRTAARNLLWLKRKVTEPRAQKVLDLKQHQNENPSSTGHHRTPNKR